KGLLAPEGWSQVAVDILAQKYFRKAGVPAQSERVPEEGVPEWLQRSRPAEGDPRAGQETDARQVFRRLAGCWTYWGRKGGDHPGRAGPHRGDRHAEPGRPAGLRPQGRHPRGGGQG